MEEPVLRRLARALGSREWSGRPISEGNLELIRAFDEECVMNGLSPRSRLHYAKQLRAAAALLGKPFGEATRADLKRVVAEYARGRSVKSVNNLKVAVKRFYQWLRGMDEGYPEEVRWMRPVPTRNRIRPEQLVTEEEFRRLLSACNNQRDRAILQLLREGGLRPHELVGLRVGDVRRTGYGMLITVDGKTGARTIPVIDAAPDLRLWLNIHAAREDPEAPLFYAFKRGGIEPLGYEGLKSVFRRLRRAAGIGRRIYPYLFRHTALTEDAKRLKEPILRKKAGWVPGSRMPAVYVHLAGRDVEEAVLRSRGLEVGEEPGTGREPRPCPRCGAQNPFDARFCHQCGADLEGGDEGEEVRRLRERLERLERENAEIRELLRRLVEGEPWRHYPRGDRPRGGG